jgi:hypothetical protein
MTRSFDTLVVTINNKQDMQIACEQHWYRIPIESVEKYLKANWSPQWLAFYQTRVFENAAFAIHTYAKVLKIQTVDRAALFPDEPNNPKSQNRYYKLHLSPLEPLPQPIVNSTKRRFTFIPTTLTRLKSAIEIRDLYD